MNRGAKALALAVAIAAPAEGLRQVAYHDPVGILTVCYGHTGPDVQRGTRYSLEQCKALLDQDMRDALADVERCHPGLPDNVLAAFGDAVFNVGPRVACDSTASKYLAGGNIPAACDELLKWNKARVGGVLVELPGLTKRRAKERALCLGGNP